MSALACLLLLAATPEQAADEVLEAFRAGESLQPLAARFPPDPWLVADELCFRGEHDAAEAFAGAAPRPDTERLPSYVASRRGRREPEDGREALAGAMAARDPAAALEALDAWKSEDLCVTSIRMAYARGLVLSRVGRRVEAGDAFAAAGGTAEALGWLGYVADCAHQGGVIALQLGDYPSTLRLFERRLAVEELRKNRAGVAYGIGNLGFIFNTMGEYQRALENYKKALAACEELGDRREVAVGFGNIGIAHKNLGNYPEAFEWLERSRKLLEELGDRAGVARALLNLGAVHQAVGGYPEALSRYERALDILEKTRDREAVATIVGNIGGVYSLMRDSPRALEYLERSRRLWAELGNREGEATAHGNIALALTQLKDHAGALEHHSRALAIREQLGDRPGIALAIANTGQAYHVAGDFEKALEYRTRALALSEDLGLPELTARNLWAIGGAHLAKGKPKDALPYARRAVESLSRLVKGLGDEQGAKAREQFRDLFQVGADAAARANDPAELAFFLESGRAGSLLESLGGKTALAGVSIPEELRRAEAEAASAERRAEALYREAVAGGRRADVQARREELDRARGETAEVVARIQREAKRAADVLYPKPRSLDAIRGALAPGEALVLYGLFPKVALALVVTGKEARIADLGSTPDVEEACRGGIEAVQRAVVDPLRLDGKVRRLLVSPSGALSDVPFARIVGGREVAYVPSGTTYLLLREERGARGEGVLALGDPEVTPRLPATREEATAIGDPALLGRDASRAGLAAALAKRSRWRAVHFACHGRIDAERPALSSLDLTGGPLQCLDIYRSSFPADLVVLSACETARGKVFTAEGVVGFTRAFMFAGAPRVIVSLSKVDDEATRALMVKFHELWKREPAATALRKAQDFVASQPKWRDPAYWAPWQLWGLPD